MRKKPHSLAILFRLKICSASMRSLTTESVATLCLYVCDNCFIWICDEWVKIQSDMRWFPSNASCVDRTLISWWRHQMKLFSVLLALCAGNSPVTGEFPSHKPVTRSFDVFFDLRLNKRLSKQSMRRWFETPLCPLWRHCNVSGSCGNEANIWCTY